RCSGRSPALPYPPGYTNSNSRTEANQGFFEALHESPPDLCVGCAVWSDPGKLHAKHGFI
ncbi:MAG: hypothetical protein L0312_26205, partial [Acidobacteria bacterium]|nr:hypothetical protein [Acidobacteriota bacterium]